MDALSAFKPAWQQAQTQQQQREKGQGQGQGQEEPLAVPPTTSQSSTVTGVAEPLRAARGSAAPREEKHGEAPSPSPRRATAGSSQATSRSEGAASFRVVSAVVTSSCEDSETEEGSTPLQPRATLEPEPGPITLHEEGSGHQHPHAAVLQPKPGPAAQLPPSEGNTASPALEVPMAIAPLPPTAPQPPPLKQPVAQPPTLQSPQSPTLRTHATQQQQDTAAVEATEGYQKHDHPRSAVRVPSRSQIREAVARTHEGLLPSSAADAVGEDESPIRGGQTSSEPGGGEKFRGEEVGRGGLGAEPEAPAVARGRRWSPPLPRAVGSIGQAVAAAEGDHRSQGKVRILLGLSRGRTCTPPPRRHRPLQQPQQRLVRLSPTGKAGLSAAALGGGASGSGSPSIRAAAARPPGLSNGLLLGEGEVCPDDEEYTTGAAGEGVWGVYRPLPHPTVRY